MRLLKCNKCGRTFGTPKKTGLPKFCSRDCYWKSSRNAETVEFERYKSVRKNAEFIIKNLLPLIFVIAGLTIAALYFIRS